MAESTMKAPKRRIDPVRWARENLFSSWHNTILTLLVGYLIVTSVGPLLNWVLLDANFQGTDPSDCTGAGACWLFINQRLNFFIYGFYPEEFQWRVDLSLIHI